MLKIYFLNEKYYDFLANQKQLPEMIQKSDRPYVGFVGIKVNNQDYVIPLTSDENSTKTNNPLINKYALVTPDEKGNKLGVLRIDKMLPVEIDEKFIQDVSMNSFSPEWAIRVAKQLHYLNQSKIYEKVNTLANEARLMKDPELKFNIDFELAEKYCKEYENMKEMKYQSWEQLFNDAWNETFKSVDDYYDERYVRDLERKVIDNDELSNSEKCAVISRIKDDLENDFHNNRFVMLEKVEKTARDMAGDENFKWLEENCEPLSWFNVNEEEGFHLHDYDEPFEFKNLNDFLTDPDDPSYLVDIEESRFIQWCQNYENEKYYESRNYSINPKIERFNLAYLDDGRFFMVGSRYQYDKESKWWNNKIDSVIEEVKMVYEELEDILER